LPKTFSKYQDNIIGLIIQIEVLSDSTHKS